MPLRKTILLPFVGLSLLASSVLSQDLADTSGGSDGFGRKPGGNESTRATFGTWGVDLSTRDLSVSPGSNFFSYANGGYFARTPIPSDRSWIGVWDQLLGKLERDVQLLIERLSATAQEGSLEQKVRDYYQSYLDVAAIEQAGLGPARSGLASIAAARSHADIVQLMATPALRRRSPISLEILIDEKHPERYVVAVRAYSSALGLPSRDYYLHEEQRFQNIRRAYLEHVERMLSLAGELDAFQQAQEIIKLETAIAERQWTKERLRNREMAYNPRNRSELIRLIPGYPWQEYLRASGLSNTNEFVLGPIEPITGIGRVFLETPVNAWKSYLRYHFIRDMADVLPPVFDMERFEFYGRTLSGHSTQMERQKRAVNETNRALGDAVGQFYVRCHFSPVSKRQVVEMVEYLKRAFSQRINNVSWMTRETRHLASGKLSELRLKIGYPDQWRDYSSLTVRPRDPFGNKLRAAEFEWRRDLERLRKPIDRNEWYVAPQTVNAFYNPSLNEIVFPAAFLQPPFFDPDADPAVNYGAIGSIIGHEMGHAFDDQGAKSDASGVLRRWWRTEDEVAFSKLGDRLAAQFDTYEVLPGLRVRGKLVLGEVIADLAGLQAAYDAYHLSHRENRTAIRDGLTGDQRFFLAFAQNWRIKFREERLRSFVMTDPHSPPEYRVNGVLRNIDAWYVAFDVKPADALYLHPRDRIRIW